LIKFPNFKIFAFSYLNCELLDPIINNVDSIENLGIYDIIYYTRFQKERSLLGDEYNIPEEYILNNQKLRTAKRSCIIMHPLPRNDEISNEVDKDKRCVYFEQVENGLLVRMAILDEFFQ
jgi:aspartate carbamoyltransferase catalytic subunit